MKFFKAIKQFFRKKPVLGGGNYTYVNCRSIYKSGADIIPGDVPVPVSDELQCTLFQNVGYVLVAMCIYEKIWGIIPWHYNEFIIWMNSSDIDFNRCTAEDIIKLMAHAINWNREEMMRPDNRFNGGTFNFVKSPEGVTTHSYSVDSGDYIFLKMNNITDNIMDK